MGTNFHYKQLTNQPMLNKNVNSLIFFLRIGNDPMELGYMISATTRGFNEEFHLKQVCHFLCISTHIPGKKLLVTTERTTHQANSIYLASTGVKPAT